MAWTLHGQENDSELEFRLAAPRAHVIVLSSFLFWKFTRILCLTLSVEPDHASISIPFHVKHLPPCYQNLVLVFTVLIPTR